MNKQVALVSSKLNGFFDSFKSFCEPLLETMDLETIDPFDGINIKNNDLIKIIIADSITPPFVLREVRQKRKDIFVCAILRSKQIDVQDMYSEGIGYLKANGVNLVLIHNKDIDHGIIVAPEESYYHEGNWDTLANGLVDMAKLRSHLTFTRSTVIAGEPVPWDSDLIPSSLRTVVDYCIAKNAYKAFRGSTAGHFAVKLNDNEFLTSIRKSNFNNLDKIGLVRIKTDGPDTVLAYGAKPSVGGQSQRIVFNDHVGFDAIVHFHCPIKDGSEVPVVSQREFECGSHQCGSNTSDHLKQFGNLKAVYLDNHGPNIVFNRNIDPQEVIDFIEANFDLEKKTGGFISILKSDRFLPRNTLNELKHLLVNNDAQTTD